MKIALVAPSPVPFTRGGAERAVAGLNQAINDLGGHDCEVVKIPVDESTLPGVIAGYRAFAGLDLAHFDRVISMKYPAWMVSHPCHTVLMFHPLRGLYDTYHVFGLPEHQAPATREVGELRALMAHWSDRRATDEFFAAFDATVETLGADHPDLAFPGPFAREAVHWLDAMALAPGTMERHLALSRTVASRPGYFPKGVMPGVVYLPGDLGPLPGPPLVRTQFFTASRLDGPKRLDLLIDAMAHVPGEIPLRIAGTGPEAENLAARAGHDPRIELLGFVPDDDLRRHYASSIAVPFLPEDEDLGLVTLEAYSQGTPVVTCTDSGGPTEFVADGRTGLVVPPDAAALGRALGRLAANPSWAADLGRAGHHVGARVTWARAAEALVGPSTPHRPPVSTPAASSDASPPSASTARLARPARRGRPARSDPSAPGGGARGGARPKVVVTATFQIDAPRHGGQLRSRHLYGALTRTHDVELLALVDHGGAPTVLELAPGLVQRTFPRSASHHQAAVEATLAAGIPVTDVVAGTHIWATPQYLDALAAAARDADAVILAEPYLLPAVEQAELRLPFVYDAFNVEADLKAEALPDTRAGRAVLAEVVRVEGRAVATSAAVTACSTADAEALARRYGRSIDAFTVIPNGTEIPASTVSTAERHRLGRRWLDDYARAGIGGRRPEHLAVFFGSWHPPNLDAVDLLAEVATALPRVLFLAVGSHGEAFRHRVLPPNLVFPGVVTDRVKSTLLDAADLALNPMRTGSGTNLKLIEYLASGVPVVSTPFGARGIDAIDGTHLLLAPPEGFADRISEALADPGAASARAEAGRALAEAHYSWSSLADRLARVLATIVVPDAAADPPRR